jgi:hypothetical protein
MFAGMLVRRAVAAKGCATGLAGTQVHPAAMCFYAFFADIVFWGRNRFDGPQVLADFVFHINCLMDLYKKDRF